MYTAPGGAARGSSTDDPYLFFFNETQCDLFLWFAAPRTARSLPKRTPHDQPSTNIRSDQLLFMYHGPCAGSSGRLVALREARCTSNPAPGRRAGRRRAPWLTERSDKWCACGPGSHACMSPRGLAAAPALPRLAPHLAAWLLRSAVCGCKWGLAREAPARGPRRPLAHSRSGRRAQRARR